MEPCHPVLVTSTHLQSLDGFNWLKQGSVYFSNFWEECQESNLGLLGSNNATSVLCITPPPNFKPNNFAAKQCFQHLDRCPEIGDNQSRKVLLDGIWGPCHLHQLDPGSARQLYGSRKLFSCKKELNDKKTLISYKYGIYSAIATKG